MAQRHIQLFRNGTPSFDATRTKHQDVVDYLLGENSPLKNLTVNDGELVLYRYKLTENGDIHTIVLAVSFPEGGTKTFEVVANYDHLTKLINELDANVTSTDGTNVNVQVKEVDGKITEVHVNDYSINATDLETAINELDTENDVTIASVTDNVVTLKAGIAQVDGLIQQGTGADITLAKVATTGAAVDVAVTPNGNLASATVQAALEELQGDIDAINGQTITAKANQAVEVTTAENGNTTIGLLLNEEEGKAILSQTAAGLKTTLTVDTKKYPTEVGAEGYVAEKAGKTYIQIKGVGGALIDETDAAAFVKDGMLNTATVVKGTWTGESFTESTDGNDKAIKLVWNTDAGKDAMYINAETLVDSYTAGNEWIVFNQTTNEISHKTPDTLTTGTYGIEAAVTGTGAYEETKTFKVPQLTVDAAGHVTVVTEQEVSIKLPAKQVASDVAVTPNGNLASATVQAALEELQGEIDTINTVEWVGDDEIKVDNDVHTIKHTEHTVSPTTSTNDTAVKAVVIPQITVNDYGHVTAIDNKTFNIDCNETTVSGTAGQIVVTPTESGEDVNYKVSLEIVSQNNTTAEHNFTDDTPNTTTVISGVSVDNYGRVTGLQTMTINENYDCGQY